MSMPCYFVAPLTKLLSFLSFYIDFDGKDKKLGILQNAEAYVGGFTVGSRFHGNSMLEALLIH